MSTLHGRVLAALVLPHQQVRANAVVNAVMHHASMANPLLIRNNLVSQLQTNPDFELDPFLI